MKEVETRFTPGTTKKHEDNRPRFSGRLLFLFLLRVAIDIVVGG